ncbi:hypothetical protein KIW84_060086 [Lathyrus oleraceus]|uniref:Zinc finger, CCHC-type n=1 Tax=Pisum sativum TaxID=3888 RepID=A0A9D5A4P4_PEA|nr:hypothetical protein KIW84_060086 [Pisum sativum]
MTANTSNNILRSILDKEKLSGTNFLDWHRNLRIVLKHDKKLYVLEKPVPEEEPPSSAPKVITYHDTLHSIALSPVASRASKQELGQTDQEVSPSIKQSCFSQSKSPRVCPSSSHDLEVYLKCLSQGLKAQRSAVNAQPGQNPKKSTVNQSSGWWSFLWNLGTMVNNQESIQLGTSFEVKVSRN